MSNDLKIPLDFERMECVRKFKLRLASLIANGNESVATGVLASLYAFRMWIDWGLIGQDWRPLRRVVSDVVNHPWHEEDLCFVIEDFCGWKGGNGVLLGAAIFVGLIKVEKRDELSGLVLEGFWPLNKHLSPDFVSMQSAGGHAKAEKRKQKQIEAAAQQRRDDLEKQGILAFESGAANESEQRLCFELILRLDRACREPIRKNANYTAEVLQDALVVVRKFTQAEIFAVEAYLVQNRRKPNVVMIPDRILQNFSDYVMEATRGK